MTIASLSDQLLAMIAANSRREDTPAPPPPPSPPKSSSSSDEAHSPDRKTRKKKKKSKKKKSKDRKSPSKEKNDNSSDQIKLNYKSMSEKKMDPIPVDDSFISEWMPRVDKREVVPIKRKKKEESEGRYSKRSRRSSSGSREASTDRDKKTSPNGQTSNDNDKMFRNRRRQEEDSKYDRHSRYERESPKDNKNKNKGSEKNRYEREDRGKKQDDSKTKRDMKYKRENERERAGKSPLSRIRESNKAKASKQERTSDDDVLETVFEKRTSESAAKKKDGKKQGLNNLPKTKLPFIGRMPILKKKVEQKPDEKDVGKKELEEEGFKEAPIVAPSFEPAVPEVVQSIVNDKAVDDLPKSTLIISKRPRLPEPGIVKKEILFNKPPNDNLMEQDMDLDEDALIPKEEETPKDELHKDFKDALDLLFPEEKKKEDIEEIKKESENKLEDQPQLPVGIPPPGYMVPPPNYDVGMYPPYYDQQAYVQQQQWVTTGYDQGPQYPPGPYAFPPPSLDQPPPVQAPIQPVPPVEPKKKKNPPSQRMRRHLMKKRAMEAGKGLGIANDGEMGDERDSDEDLPDNGEMQYQSRSDHSSKSDRSDLAMLGIDEDDAAAQHFY